MIVVKEVTKKLTNYNFSVSKAMKGVMPSLDSLISKFKDIMTSKVDTTNS